MENCAENKKPKILILATISGGYAGADAVGQLHAEYPNNTYILPVIIFIFDHLSAVLTVFSSCTAERTALIKAALSGPL